MATDTPKLLYVEVVDGSNGKDNPASEDDSSSSPPSSFRYTRSMLQSTLQLMGCKARHAFKISRRVFDMMRADHLPGNKKLAQLKVSSEVLGGVPAGDDQSCLELKEGHSAAVHTDENQSIPYELYKKLTTVIVPRETFLDVVCNALTQYKYVGPNQRADLILACRIRERKESVTILLCGTSGCGKSTLSSLLGSRLGITTVISTDSIRHMMRSFVNEKQNPLLWASTYHAGEHLDPVAVAESKAKRKAKKTAGVAMPHSLDYSSDGVLNPNANSSAIDGDLVSKKLMAIEGYKAQSEMVIDSLDRLITTWEERKESVVVEGVHLSLNFVVGLMKKHPSIIPFMIYITTEDKHMERFAVRAKYMTLDPSKNKYVKYIRNIRTIQEYLCNRADKHLVPKINNTNVDRSVAAIHATVFSCLRRRVAGEQLYDSTTNTVPIIDAEYRNQCAANTLSSKGMFQLIQRKGSFRHLMALVENDGSVAKVWPMESVGENKNIPFEGAEKSLGDPVYDASSIGKAEPVNLQFGSYGISAWPNESCGTSQNGSIDEAIADCGTDAGSRYHSSCCSSPRMSDVPDKEPKEELSVSGSDDEVDDPLGADTDDDLSDTDEKLMQEEMEGSVDEGSTKSDEEYEDLAIRDGTENGYWSDDDESFNSNKKLLQGNGDATASSSVTDAGSKISSDQNKYLHNLDVFLRSSGERLSHDQPCSYSLLSVKGGGVRSADGRFDKARRHSFGDASWLHGDTQGIAALDRKGSTCGLIF